jgi:methylase of polypeptide subunit release factors
MTRERLHEKRKNEHSSETAEKATDESNQLEMVTFLNMSLAIERGELRPRPSSAVLVEACLEDLLPSEASNILDLGCGCGALLLAVLQRGPPKSRGWGLDIEPRAVNIATTNAARLLHRDVDDLQSPGRLQSDATPRFHL